MPPPFPHSESSAEAARIHSSRMAFIFSLKCVLHSSSSSVVGRTELNTEHPAPVTVHCDVGVRWLPSSKG